MFESPVKTESISAFTNKITIEDDRGIRACFYDKDISTEAYHKMYQKLLNYERLNR
jgi:hypothetical protein